MSSINDTTTDNIITDDNMGNTINDECSKTSPTKPVEKINYVNELQKIFSIFQIELHDIVIKTQSYDDDINIKPLRRVIDILSSKIDNYRNIWYKLECIKYKPPSDEKTFNEIVMKSEIRQIESYAMLVYMLYLTNYGCGIILEKIIDINDINIDNKNDTAKPNIMHVPKTYELLEEINKKYHFNRADESDSDHKISPELQLAMMYMVNIMIFIMQKNINMDSLGTMDRD